jgi:hypothetical protein
MNLICRGTIENGIPKNFKTWFCGFYSKKQETLDEGNKSVPLKS